MIGREEIESKAAELSVNPTDVERDYVNGWLLSSIAASGLRDDLVLKGGNALRKAFFANTRYSKDLDFTAPHGIGKDRLCDELRPVCERVSQQTGVRFETDRLTVIEKNRVSASVEVLEVRAYFLDFYRERRAVPLRVFMDVAQYDRLLLPAVERPLIHGYSDADACAASVRCSALEEILASKLKCLLQRRHAADLFDYLRWLFFEDVAIDRAQVLRVFLKKTIYDRAPGAAYELLSNLPFKLFHQMWDRFITCPVTCPMGFDDGVRRFKAHLETLFGVLRDRHSRELSFFPAALREPIMSAGRNNHVMRIVYRGEERIIEPYSLRFKERQDGGGGEYLYTYKLSGGSTGPGVRQFVPEAIEELVELDVEFEPRFEVEVAKAGDPVADSSFHQSRRAFIPGFGMTRGNATRSRRSGSRPRHRVRCRDCGKLFYRTKHQLKLLPHTDPRGGRCYATWGEHEGWG